MENSQLSDTFSLLAKDFTLPELKEGFDEELAIEFLSKASANF